MGSLLSISVNDPAKTKGETKKKKKNDNTIVQAQMFLCG